MTLLGLIIVLIVVGFCLWLVNTYVPMQAPVKTVLNVVVVLILLIWILSAIGAVGIFNTPIVIRR
jgi:hypothetical protein